MGIQLRRPEQHEFHRQVTTGVFILELAGVSALVSAFLDEQRDEVISCQLSILKNLPACQGIGCRINVGLNLCARPFLDIAVVSGMTMLLKVDESLGSDLQMVATTTSAGSNCLLGIFFEAFYCAKSRMRRCPPPRGRDASPCRCPRIRRQVRPSRCAAASNRGIRLRGQVHSSPAARSIRR